jgi:hypothetical protein
MKESPDFKIVTEYSGKPPNWKPMARAFVRAVEKLTGPDGCFTDPALEAEFQEWLKEQKRKGA